MQLTVRIETQALSQRRRAEPTPVFLRTLSAHGHAPPRDNRDGVSALCAAVTVLCRTTAHALSLNTALLFRYRAPHEGSFDITLTDVPPAQEVWLSAITTFLTAGLEDLQREYPRLLRVDVVR